MTRPSFSACRGRAAGVAVVATGALLMAACGSSSRAAHRTAAALRASGSPSVATVVPGASPAPATGAAAGGSAPAPATAAASGTAAGSLSSAPGGSATSSPSVTDNGAGTGSRAPTGTGAPTGTTDGTGTSRTPGGGGSGSASPGGSSGSSSPPASSGGPAGSGFGGGTHAARVSVVGAGGSTVPGVGQPATFTATLSPPAGEPPPTGSMVFTISQPGGGSQARACTATVAASHASCSVTFPAAGSWFVDAYYDPGTGTGGSSTYVPSQGSTTVTVR